MSRTRAYRGGELVDEGFPVDRISDHLDADPATVVWVDLLDPELPDLQHLAGEFGLHPMALEDAVQDHQRPKVDRYEHYLFLNVYAVELDRATGALETSEVSSFVLERALITVRKDDGIDLDALVSLWDETADLAEHGVAYLLHGLLDHVVDGHFDAVQSLDDGVEELEDQLFADEPQDRQVQRRSFALRKSLVLTRRVVLPMREVLNTLMRRDVDLVGRAMAPYYQDVYDHVLRVTEWTESLRDLVTSVLETNLTIQSNRLNEIMKKLTAWAAIIAIPTAVTGFFGQNVPYPGFQQEWGFLLSIVLIAGIGAGLWLMFRRRGWL
ncbi:magnesium transporter CorA family protein [Rhodococcus aerolatus]